MKKALLYAVVMTVVACNSITVDFTFSPTEPKAGEKISFTNACSGGESWQWDFGDNGKSTLKSPTKIYKKPGTYLVTLQVDSTKSRSCSHSITVYDTIPTFVSSLDSITHFKNDTLTANIYNPYSYTLTYQWTLPKGCELVSGELTDKEIVVYFTQYNDSATVNLVIGQGSKTFDITRSLWIYESQGPAILMQTDASTYRQRILHSRLEEASAEVTTEDRNILNKATDTLLTYNNRTFTLSTITDLVGIEVAHFAVDAMAQKWYVTNSTGLYVAGLGGDYVTRIDAAATGALYVDNDRNRVYWATATGLNGMPLVKSARNQFSTEPEEYNRLAGIQKIALNNTDE